MFFGHFLHNFYQNHHYCHHNYHLNIIVIVETFFCNSRRTSFVASEKRGPGEGELIWALPERKHFFLLEIVPKKVCLWED